MSALLDSYTKNKSPEDKKLIEDRVKEIELTGQMTELSAILQSCGDYVFKVQFRKKVT